MAKRKLPYRTIEICVPFMDIDYKHYFSSFDSVIDELLALSNKLVINLTDTHKTHLFIEKLTDLQVKNIFRNKRSRNFTKHFIKFKTTIFFNTEKEIEDLLFGVSILIEYYIKHLIIYLNIAKPGAFDSRQGVIIDTLYYGGKKQINRSDFDMLSNSIGLSLDLMATYKWPPIKELKIKETLDWLALHWEAFLSTPENRIQRALNAFSYLFHDNLGDNSPSDLFFSLVGIEALFVEGNDSVQKQVDTKSQIILGKREIFKKKFTELYDFRSRFIHGQLNFINKYSFRDSNPNVVEHLDKTHNNVSLAILILISSIQKHILLNKTELNFDLVLKD